MSIQARKQDEKGKIKKESITTVPSCPAAAAAAPLALSAAALPLDGGRLPAAEGAEGRGRCID